MDSDEGDEVMEVPGEYEPVFEESENYVVAPTSVISDGICLSSSCGCLASSFSNLTVIGDSRDLSLWKSSSFFGTSRQAVL